MSWILIKAMDISAVSTGLREYLEPVANWFIRFDLPEPIVHWGHPVMMAIVVFVMGGFAGYAGWKGRLAASAADIEIAAEQKQQHARIAPLMYVFILTGASGGILSLVMQGEPIFESFHFWTGMGAIALLTINATIAATRFGQGSNKLRTAHAYIGSVALVLLVIHAFFGTRLGLSI